MPRESLFSIFRTPVSEVQAAQKRAWAFSSGALFLGIGVLNLMLGNVVIGMILLLGGVILLGQGLLLLGYRQSD